MSQIQILKANEIKDLKEFLWKENDEYCPICSRKHSLDKMVLDHSHQKKVKGTGLIRGAICHLCNVLLGKIENNSPRYKITQGELPGVLRAMADYLEQEHLPYLHPTEKQPEPKLKKTSFNKLLKAYNGKKVIEYPKSGKLTQELSKLFNKYNIIPEFYKGETSDSGSIS